MQNLLSIKKSKILNKEARKFYKNELLNVNEDFKQPSKNNPLNLDLKCILEMSVRENDFHNLNQVCSVNTDLFNSSHKKYNNKNYKLIRENKVINNKVSFSLGTLIHKNFFKKLDFFNF